MNFFKIVFKYKRSRVWAIVTISLVVLLLVVSILASTVLYTLISVILGGERNVGRGSGRYYEIAATSKEDAYNRGNSLNIEICEEGFVLLKNEFITADKRALPLAEGSKISVFGKNSVNLVYGGSGSGGGNTAGAKTIFESLTAAGFSFNPALKAFYEDKNKSGGGRQSNPKIENNGNANFDSGETPWDSYDSDLKNSVNDFKDAAIIVLSRIGGEGFDLPRKMKNAEDKHYLQFDGNESNLISGVKGMGFGRIIVVINSSSTMEIGDIAGDSAINAIIHMGGPGFTGVMALGRILNGSVTPSGRTVDTWAADFKKDPTWNNFGDNRIAYMSGTKLVRGNQYLEDTADSSYYYVDYEEGIYSGYRYYETRGFTDGEMWHNTNVVYPLGYGLSYTSFSWEIENAASLTGITVNDTNKNSDIEIKVKVTNTGSVKGKDVVELYCTPKYNPGGIEKPYVLLCGFEKTPELYPASQAGEGKPNSCTVTLKFNPYDIASYDYNDANGNGFKGYELDGGNYDLKLQTDAHKQKPDVAVVSFHVAEGGIKYDIDPITGAKVENRFTDAADELKDNTFTVNGETLTRKGMSRADWAGTWPKDANLARRQLTAAKKSALESVEHNNPETSFEETLTGMPVTKKLIEMRGLPYNDGGWKEILDSLTFNEMKGLFNEGAFGTVAIARIGKPATIESDGPVGFTNFMSEEKIYGTVSYAAEVVIGSTWNRELLTKMGESIGEEGAFGKQNIKPYVPYSGWYAPGINIHRSQFGGRNFEYFSEDGYLTGHLAAAQIKGAAKKGVYTFMKHFALNDQETCRDKNGLCTWATEQSIREIYLRPFEIAVKEGGARGVMSAFNRIGTKWTGGDYRLLTEILRNEWGFRGTVICDFNVSPFMNSKQMIYAGGDLNLTTTRPWMSASAGSAADVAVLRRAAHNILYTVVNSNAMNGIDINTQLKTLMPIWQVLMICADAAIAASLAIWGHFTVSRVYKRKRVL